MKIGNLRREYMRDNFNRIVSGEGQSLKFIRFISRFLSLSIFAFCVAVLPAYAQSDDFPGGGGLGDGSEPIDARAAGDIQSQTNQERLSLLTNDLMGDQIDLDTGQLRFSATDVSISGNSNLPVQFGRSADRNVTIGWMAAWAPDIPHIRRRYIDQTDDVNGYNPKFKRCSVGNNGLNLVKDFRTWAPQTYFRGMHFVNFGAISKNFPSDLAYPSYTHKDANLSSIGDTGPTTAYTEYTFLSRIEDVHGNWVIYDYVGGKPTVIRSNDGRRIDINWSGDRISSVATNGRAWYYLYPSCSRSKCSRLEVTLPDQRKWEYELSSDVFRRSGVDPLCLHDPNPIATTVKHPSGTTASFTFDVISNGRKNLHLSQYSGDDWGRAPGDQCYKGATHLPRSFNSIAVKTKTLNISDSPDAIWTYDYEQDFGQYAGEPYIGPGPYQGADLPVTKWREVTNPDGTKVKSYINRDFSFLEGQIVKIETRSSNNTLLRTVTTQYQQGHKVGSRSTGHPQGTTAATSHIVSEVLKETLQGSEIFSSSQSYDHDIESATYSYGKPIKQRSWSTIYGSTGKKGTNTTYEHQTTPWILGLTKTVSEVSATGESREALGFTYNSLGQKTAQTRYGQPWVAFTYHTSGVQNGLLESVSDALPTPRTTWARNWKRGVPQEIERPDGRIEKQDVDNNGWLTADHDAKGYITSYAHDSMGRMTLIDPPGSWANTDIEYSFPSEGGATQTITKEQSKTTITYDSMLRPTLERTEALDTQWSVAINIGFMTPPVLTRNIVVTVMAVRAIKTIAILSDIQPMARVSKEPNFTRTNGGNCTNFNNQEITIINM